jgi:hypothetical protein
MNIEEINHLYYQHKNKLLKESHPYGGDYEEEDPDQEYDLKGHLERKQEEEDNKEEDAEAFAGPQTGEYKISYKMRQGNDAATIVPFEKLANTIKIFLDKNLIITGISIFVKE